MYWAFRHIQGREAWMTDGAFIDAFQPSLGPGVRERFEWSKSVTTAQYDAACDFRARYTAMFAKLIGDDGVLIVPTMPDIAPLVSEPEANLQAYRDAAIKMLCISGLTGFPQLTLPWATRGGAPLSISLIGPAGSDRSLISLVEHL
jgi:amidase